VNAGDAMMVGDSKSTSRQRENANMIAAGWSISGLEFMIARNIPADIYLDRMSICSIRRAFSFGPVAWLTAPTYSSPHYHQANSIKQIAPSNLKQIAPCLPTPLWQTRR